MTTPSETDLYDNPFVYLSDRDQLKYKKYFSDKTIYFTSFQVSWEDAKDGLCYVHVDKWHKYNYIIISSKNNRIKKLNINNSTTILYLFLNFS